MSAADVVDDTSKTEHKSQSQHSDQAESTASSHIPPEIASLSQLSISEPKTEASSSSSTASNKWTLWRYDCRDMPGHKCFTMPCAFCDQVNKLKGVSKGKVTESTDRWESYLKKGKSFEDEQMLTKTLGEFLPSKLAKDVFFNRKLGVGIFRGDIEPKSENAENVDGIVFQLLFLVTSGRKSAALMRKFDEIFLHALRLTFDLPPPIACHVNGIFLRCEMNPGKGLEKEQNPYGNLMDLPIMAKLEIWIGDRSHKESVCTTLISEIRARSNIGQKKRKNAIQRQISCQTQKAHSKVKMALLPTLFALLCSVAVLLVLCDGKIFTDANDKDLYKEPVQKASLGENAFIFVTSLIVMPALIFGVLMGPKTFKNLSPKYAIKFNITLSSIRCIIYFCYHLDQHATVSPTFGVRRQFVSTAEESSAQIH
uniref:Uncharacterized protein n=1 Tax=Globodera rostochiensis TaxID=31243 RepID=A0A914I1C1_GLORO